MPAVDYMILQHIVSTNKYRTHNTSWLISSSQIQTGTTKSKNNLIDPVPVVDYMITSTHCIT